MDNISFQEQHIRLLKIAKEFDKICTENNIPYYMLGGTMLGAIRHKGFIPWDDDMDFGVPRPYYSKLISLLEKELHKPYKCCSYENSKNVYSPFFKVEDTYTVIYDKRIPLPMNEQMGINIDVFPLDYCNADSFRTRFATFLCNVYSAVYIDSYDGSKIKNIVKKVLRTIIPYSRVQFLRMMNAKLESSNTKGALLANVFGRWRKKEWIPIEWYGENVRYKFENIELCGLKEYDKYLTQMYGDYMQLPKKEMQIPHAENVFVRG